MTMARWEANLQALHTLAAIEDENREATAAERTALSQFSGFGDTAFNAAFQTTGKERGDIGEEEARKYRGLSGVSHYADSGSKRWAERGDELRDLLTNDEYDSIRESRLTAFYTNPHIIKSMWQGLEDMGAADLDEMKVLEPSAGSGRFITGQPRAMRDRTTWTAVEQDALTGRMLGHATPDDVRVQVRGFEETQLPDDSYDIVISNIPFGNQGVHDPEYLRSGKGHLTRSVHDYFFAKAMDKVRPGGVVAFVTSRFFMDKGNSHVRRHLAEEADLVGAVRLPADAFPDTPVITDIVYLRKRLPGEDPGDRSWVDVEMVDIEGTEHRVNKYFGDNPEMVLGEQRTAKHGMYGREGYEVAHQPGAALEPRLASSLKGALQGMSFGEHIAAASTKPSPGEWGDGRYVVRDGKLAVEGRRNGEIVYSDPKLPRDDTERVRDLVEIRDAARTLVGMESVGVDSASIEDTRGGLRDLYMAYVEEHGEALNSPKNESLIGIDRDSSLLFSLERYDNDQECWQPSSILYERAIGAAPKAQIATAPDAMMSTLAETGRLNFERMGEKLGQDADSVRDSLAASGHIFHDPVRNEWQGRSRYLSGDVREKLRQSQTAVQSNPSYRANAEALEGVQPAWIGSEDIDARMGAPWIGDAQVNRWIAERMNIRNAPRGGDKRFFAYEPDSGRWVKRYNFPPNEAYNANRVWGTGDMKAQELLERVLKGGSLHKEGMTSEEFKRVQQQASQMQQDFEDWLWSDPKRASELERTYNDTFNAVRHRQYDGSHLTFPGMAEKWRQQLYPFQRGAVQRVIEDGTALLAHEVGFGKSSTMIASAMERKRLGLINKPMFVVLKSTQQNFADEFMRMYPGARILVPDEDDFSADERRRFVSSIATGNWDAVILTDGQFERIPMSPGGESRWVSSDLAELESSMQTLEDDPSQERPGDRMSEAQKAVDNAVKARRKKLQDLLATATKDKDVEYFDTLGVDALYVDEADRYKNLPFRTSMGGRNDSIKGLNPGANAKRSWDMFMKVRHLQDDGDENTGVVFATGTPVANSLAETWTMMRYLDEPGLRSRGLDKFDAFAKTFGIMDEAMEVSAAGEYRPTRRFRDFTNLPELKQTFAETADRRIAEETPVVEERRPHLVGGERIIVTSPETPALKVYMSEIQGRAHNLPFPPSEGGRQHAERVRRRAEAVP